jgi:outer membrane protein assembly factor BamD (BamD/ComL family)
MKTKVAIVATLFWLVALIGGGLWPRFEQYLQLRRTPPGLLEVQKLNDLYSAGLLREALQECDRADGDARYSAYEPQILFVQWAANRQLGKQEEADRVQQVFLSRFPDNRLSADMHLATAMSLLEAGKYAQANRELMAAEERFAGQEPTAQVQQIRTKLARTIATPIVSDPVHG